MVHGLSHQKALAVDNIFVFAVILGSFSVPPALQHRVLFFGVVGALVLRAVFIAVGATLIDTFSWTIPAIFTVTDDTFIVFTSNAFAILALRSLYFLLSGALHRVKPLSKGLAAILVFIGVKMLAIDVVHVSVPVSLVVIATILAVAVGASWRANAPEPIVAEVRS